MSLLQRLFAVFLILVCSSCSKFRDYNQEPELESLRQGLKTTAAIGYCTSVVMAVVEGQALPENVSVQKGTGIICVKIDNDHPLPFNKNIGDIFIAYDWSGTAGLMSVLFANIDLLGGNIKLCGLHLVPIMKQTEGDGVTALLTKQDIVIGNGSDTLLDMSNITDIVFNERVDRLNAERPDDAFVAVKQNVWFIDVDPKKTFSNLYDDGITINGGGQMAEVRGASGGIIYHAMIGTKLNYSLCNHNPVSGVAFSQNFKAGGEPYIDLGNSLLSFRSKCDGKAHVDLSTGKYIFYMNKDISLNLN
jgi:hypothetical protein